MTPFERILLQRHRQHSPDLRRGGKQTVKCVVGGKTKAPQCLVPNVSPVYNFRIKRGAKFSLKLDKKEARSALHEAGRNAISVASSRTAMRAFFEAHPDISRYHWKQLHAVIPKLLDRTFGKAMYGIGHNSTGFHAKIKTTEDLSFSGVLRNNTVAASSLVGSAAGVGEVIWNANVGIKHHLRPKTLTFVGVSGIGGREVQKTMTLAAAKPNYRTWTKTVKGGAAFGGLLAIVGTELEYGLDSSKKFLSTEHLVDLSYNFGKSLAAGAVGAKVGGSIGGPLGLAVGFLAGVGASMIIDAALYAIRWVGGLLADVAKVLYLLITDPSTFFRTLFQTPGQSAALDRHAMEQLRQQARQREYLKQLVEYYLRWLFGIPHNARARRR